MENTLISIILSIKEFSKELNLVFNSIYAQTMKNFELIVVSPDKSELTEEFKNKYGFQLFFYDKGKNASRNYGSKIAKGKYLLFLDDDMLLDENVLRECLDKVRENNTRATAIPEKVQKKNGFFNKTAILEKELAELDSQIISPRFLEKELYYELGEINENLDPIDEGDLKAKIEEKNISFSSINSCINILLNNRLFSLKKRVLHLYERGKKMPLFNELHPKSKQLKFFERGKNYLINYKYFLRSPFSALFLAVFKTFDFFILKIGSLNISKQDKKILSDIKNKKIFEKEAKTYQKEFFENTVGAKYVDQKEQKIVEDYLQNLDKNSSIKILDIGPGGGRWSELMLKKFPNAEVIGCDLSQGMVNELNKKFKNESRFKAVVGDMQNLPFDSNKFDLVISIRAIKYAQDQEKVFKEIKRVLKPESYAIIELPYLNFVYRLIKTIKIFGKLSEYANRINLKKKNEIINALNLINLKVLDVGILFSVPATFYKKVNDENVLKLINIINKILSKETFGRSLFIFLKFNR